MDHQAEEEHPDRKHGRRRKSDSSSSPGEDSDSDIQTLDDEDQGKKEDSRGEKDYGLDVDDVGSDEEDKYEDDDDIASIQSEPSGRVPVGFYPFSSDSEIGTEKKMSLRVFMLTFVGTR